MTFDLPTISTLCGIFATLFVFAWFILKGYFVTKTDFESYKNIVETEMKLLSSTHSKTITELALVNNNIGHMMESQKEFKLIVEKTNDKLFGEIEHLAASQKQLGDNLLIYIKQLNESK